MSGTTMHGITIPDPQEELADARGRLLEELDKFRRMIVDDTHGDKVTEQYGHIGRILSRRDSALRKITGRIDLDAYAREEPHALD